MVLTSPRFADNTRLQRAAENMPALKAFETDKEAVGLLQLALRDLRDPRIGTLPKSFSAGGPDGIYASETAGAVTQFQRREKLTADGAAGHDTLHALDLLFPPTKPDPPKPKPPTEDEIVAFLKGRLRRRVVSVMIEHEANMIVLGEVHVGQAHKSFLLHELIRALARRRAPGAHFHASEQFFDRHRPEIRRFLHATPQQRSQLMFTLDADLRQFVAALSAAADFPEHRYAMLPAGSTISGRTDAGADARHTDIFKAFERSVHLHNSENAQHITTRTSRGNLLVGAFHAARLHTSGRPSKTTTQLLSDAGWNVHVIRIVVDLPTISPRDSDELRARDGSGSAIHLLSVLREVAGGKHLYADITGADSPFARLRGRDTINRPYNELFDSVMYLPETVPFGGLS
jgi:peptidoglycan hydrolase-like protein with peptidoglycan-binding domain